MLAGQPPKKKEKPEESNRSTFTFGFMRQKLGKLTKKPAAIKILLNSGASHSIVQYDKVKKLCLKNDEHKITWTSLGGKFQTKLKTHVLFTLNEFDDNITLHHDFIVSRQPSNYDMIIGADLLDDLGIVLDFKNREMVWGHRKVPMKHRGDTWETSFHVREESKPVLDAT